MYYSAWVQAWVLGTAPVPQGREVRSPFIYSFTILPLSLCTSKFLTCIIFLLPEEFLTTSCQADLLVESSFNFYLSEKFFLSTLLLLDNFTT